MEGIWLVLNLKQCMVIILKNNIYVLFYIFKKVRKNMFEVYF